MNVDDSDEGTNTASSSYFTQGNNLLVEDSRIRSEPDYKRDEATKIDLDVHIPPNNCNGQLHCKENVSSATTELNSTEKKLPHLKESCFSTFKFKEINNKCENLMTRTNNLEEANIQQMEDAAMQYICIDMTIPLKKENCPEVENRYDGFIPINEHRKSMRGEKLYVTMDRSGKERKTKCVGICMCTLAASIILSILIVVGSIGTGKPLHRMSTRHYDENKVQVKKSFLPNEDFSTEFTNYFVSTLVTAPSNENLSIEISRDKQDLEAVPNIKLSALPGIAALNKIEKLHSEEHLYVSSAEIDLMPNSESIEKTLGILDKVTPKYLPILHSSEKHLHVSSDEIDLMPNSASIEKTLGILDEVTPKYLPILHSETESGEDLVVHIAKQLPEKTGSSVSNRIILRTKKKLMLEYFLNIAKRKSVQVRAETNRAVETSTNFHVDVITQSSLKPSAKIARQLLTEFVTTPDKDMGHLQIFTPEAEIYTAITKLSYISAEETKNRRVYKKKEKLYSAQIDEDDSSLYIPYTSGEEYLNLDTSSVSSKNERTSIYSGGNIFEQADFPGVLLASK